MAKKPYARSQSYRQAVFILGTSSPVGSVRAPKIGTFFWDEVAQNLYVSKGTGVSDWDLVAQAASSSPTAFDKVDSFDVTSDGQTVFALTNTPANPSASEVTVNGLKLIYTAHYTISGTTLTLNLSGMGFQTELSNEFGEPDRVIAKYFT